MYSEGNMLWLLWNIFMRPGINQLWKVWVSSNQRREGVLSRMWEPLQLARMAITHQKRFLGTHSSGPLPHLQSRGSSWPWCCREMMEVWICLWLAGSTAASLRRRAHLGLAAGCVAAALCAQGLSPHGHRASIKGQTGVRGRRGSRRRGAMESVQILTVKSAAFTQTTKMVCS